ncbi:acyl-CoA dehydrogenase family protein [Alcaligenes faecalis]|uniref:Acyl-CoA dehydrogenase family protein n=1 Tax=Alcaligenes faecalis TaxID=511 RepID=A0AAE9H6L9_ALCFA|nr:acyl-CoA dehydrogenase family protein [Alcaligenes faecalis]UPL20490.1 acyl-CoA dehydrogenase family protein [Alcaligenes faecalis]
MGLEQQLQNQVPDLMNDDLFGEDPALQHWQSKLASQEVRQALADYGQKLGSAHWREQGALANRQLPQWRGWSAQGQRVDQVDFHPAWHQLMSLGMEQGLHIWPHQSEPGQHLQRAMGFYMHGQIEAGTLCPLTMTRAAAPLLQADPFQEWAAKLDINQYDSSDQLMTEKSSVLLGMGMTEMQGGSDLRGCTTEAHPQAQAFRLYGHKWFFSVPQADGHLVLAREHEQFSCFLMPRYTEYGLNRRYIRRLKDKLGNRSNASAEIDFDGALAWRVGQAGRGIALLAGMAARTRIDCVLGSAALMRQALVQSLHYCQHRRCFGKQLIDQPLMQAVLLDMSLESEAATHLALFLVDLQERADDPVAQAVLRVLAPAAKFWVCRRAIALCAEAMETWGGNGYIEDGPMPRLLREAPVNSIWEGSGNVMCLDVQRALSQEGVLEALQADLRARTGDDAELGQVAQDLLSTVSQAGGRVWAQKLALLYQACLMRQVAPDAVADLFATHRLQQGPATVFGLEGVEQASWYLHRIWPRLQAS